MKKIIFTMIIFMVIPLSGHALDYNAKLSGSNNLYSYPLDEQQTSEYIKPHYKYFTQLYIDIKNIENIKSVTINIKYDKEKFTVLSCSLLNYIGEPCKGWNEIYYNYNAQDSYNLKDNSLYTVTFIPIKNTPDTGTTEIEVYFENTIDKDGNDIFIEPIKKIYNFKNYKERYQITQIVPTEPSNTDDEIKNEQKNNQKNDLDNSSSIENKATNEQENKSPEETSTPKRPENKSNTEIIKPKTAIENSNSNLTFEQENTENNNNDFQESNNNSQKIVETNEKSTEIKPKKTQIKKIIIISTTTFVLLIIFTILIYRKKHH